MRSVNLRIGRGERGNGMREAMAAKLDKSRIKGGEGIRCRPHTRSLSRGVSQNGVAISERYPDAVRGGSSLRARDQVLRDLCK